MSPSSGSSKYSAPLEPTELGWKEGHILKGLKRLRMSKAASTPASVPQCKDYMTSNEGIYSLGVKCGLLGSPASKKVDAELAALDSDDGNYGPPELLSMESSDQLTKEHVCLGKPDVTRDDDNNFQEGPVKTIEYSDHFPSPITDNSPFLEGPTGKPGVSPTVSLMHLEDKHSLEKQESSDMKLSDRNNNQERSTDRKSRLDLVNRRQGRLAMNQAKVEGSDMRSSHQHVATSALSCTSAARQRSSSMEVPPGRDQPSQTGSQSQNYAISEFPQRKPKPQPCGSARKAFILRSKSADGGQEQHKQTHSPLQQELIKGHRSKGQSNPPGHCVPSKNTNLNRTQGSNRGALSQIEKDEDGAAAAIPKSLKGVQQQSPLASPVMHSKTPQAPGVGEFSKSPTKMPSQITRQSSNNFVEESIYDNLPCSPRKQRRKDQHCDVTHSEYWSPSPPAPPGRTTSLLLRPTCERLPKIHTQNSITGKRPSNTKPQQPNTTKDNQHLDHQVGAEAKPPTDIYHSPVPAPESHVPESFRLPVDRATKCHFQNGSPSILPSQSILQRSQQSISEPKLSEVLPQIYSNVCYQGIANNRQSSSSKAAKKFFSVNAKSQEAISGQETGTFLAFGRQNKDNSNLTQTFQTFTCHPQMMHECEAHEKASRKIETRCSSLDSEPVQPVTSESGVMLDWGFDEEGWLFKRSVSVSTRPPLKPVMGMNGAKARSQSFGARYVDRPSFKVRTQIKTHSGSSLNSINDVLPGSMSCSSSYHCPVNRSLLNSFLIEEGLTVPSHLGSSSERLQCLKQQREQARRLQIEQQFSSAFGEPVSEEPERQSIITTIEEKVMLGIEENLHKNQEQGRSNEVKQKSGSSLANWFGFRKSKVPAPSNKKTDQIKLKEDKREQKITSLLGGKQSKSDKKRDRKKSDGKDW